MLKECVAACLRTELQRRTHRRGPTHPNGQRLQGVGGAWAQRCCRRIFRRRGALVIELTTAVGNINKVFDLMLKRATDRRWRSTCERAAASVGCPSGVMEDQKLYSFGARRMSLPDCYGDRQSVRDARCCRPRRRRRAPPSRCPTPPIDRKRFKISSCRHRSLRRAAGSDGRQGAGGWRGRQTQPGRRALAGHSARRADCRTAAGV